MKETDKEKRIHNLLNDYLPGVKLDAIRSGSDLEVRHAYYAVSNANKDLKDSQYYYKGKPEFIHFTSLLALESIIQSRSIRLYNLFNLNDPREYSFSAKLFDYTNKNENEARTNMFLLSMCNSDILARNKAKEEFNMWRLYGQGGYGVALELGFTHCELELWKDFYLSKIFYGASSKSKLADLAQILSNLEEEIPKCVFDFGQLMCFHKSNLYGIEKEVRLLYDMRQTKSFGETNYSNHRNQRVFPIIRADITKSIQTKKDIKYLELPIYYNGFNLKPTIATPKITKVTLGYQYYNNEGLITNVKEMIKDYLGYGVPVEVTRLSVMYNDIRNF
jgi:hypothetical protein